jgi:hypothetical protein
MRGFLLPASVPGSVRPPRAAGRGAAGAAGSSGGAPPAAPAKRPHPPGSGSSGSDSGVPARRSRMPPAERARLLALGYDSVDLDLEEGHWAWEEEDDGLDYGGVPMRDEGADE